MQLQRLEQLQVLVLHVLEHEVEQARACAGAAARAAAAGGTPVATLQHLVIGCVGSYSGEILDLEIPTSRLFKSSHRSTLDLFIASLQQGLEWGSGIVRTSNQSGPERKPCRPITACSSCSCRCSKCCSLNCSSSNTKSSSRNMCWCSSCN